MRINIKCSSAIHILLMIALLPDSCKVTSNLLASSVGSNPVEIRRLLSSLKKAGIIDVARGQGGATLRRTPENITLLDIYNAVDLNPLDELIGIHSHPTQQCPFGKNIGDVLAEPYAKIGQALGREMSQITLAQLCQEMEHRAPDISLPGC